MFQYSQHLFSRDYTSSFCICFSSIALFYTAHFPCSPPVPNFHTATAIHLICISSHHMAAFYTIPRHSSSVRQQLSHSSFSHSFTHTYFSISHSFFTHSHSLILSHFFISPLLSPTAVFSQHLCSSRPPPTPLSLLGCLLPFALYLPASLPSAASAFSSPLSLFLQSLDNYRLFYRALPTLQT